MGAPVESDGFYADLQREIADLQAQHALDQAVIAHLESAELIAREKVAHLETALRSSRRIGAAIGVLMTSRHLTETQAFDLLRTASQRDHRKLREIAEDVVLTGELPNP